LLARMGNIKVGKFVDDETGESLNDVENVLDSLGINLRDKVTGEFRNFADVLDEVGAKWESYDNTAQHAIATALAGTRQQEKLFVLMSNYGTALDYANTAAESSGTAAEKYEAVTAGLEAAFNSLTTSWEEFSQSVLNSDLIVGGVELLSRLVTVLNEVASAGGGVAITITGAIAGYAALVAMYKKIELAQRKHYLSILQISDAQVKGITTAELYGLAQRKAAGEFVEKDSLRNAINNISKGESAVADYVVGFNKAISALSISASIIISVLQIVNNARKKYKQEIIESANAAKTEAAELAELSSKYKEVLSEVNKGTKTQEELQSVKDEWIAKLKLEREE